MRGAGDLRFSDLVRLPIRALDTETAQRTFEFGYTLSYPLEILTGERQESHRRTRHHRGRPLPRQQKSNLAERVARAQALSRFATVVQDFGRSLFDEIDRGSVIVDRDDRGVRLDFDLSHRGGEFVQLLGRQVGEVRKSRDPTRVHDMHRATGRHVLKSRL
jgi:hypothetical protein